MFVNHIFVFLFFLLWQHAELNELALDFGRQWICHLTDIRAKLTGLLKHPFSCPGCDQVLYDARTLCCGHTMCWGCTSRKNSCVKCDYQQDIQPAMNVTASNLALSWCRPVVPQTESSSHAATINKSRQKEPYTPKKSYEDALEAATRANSLRFNWVAILNVG